jgi:hypothetical protein
LRHASADVSGFWRKFSVSGGKCDFPTQVLVAIDKSYGKDL